MACLILKNPDGIERKIAPSPDGQFRYAQIPGEQIVEVDYQCSQEIPVGGPSDYWRDYNYRKCSNCGEKGVYESS